MKRNLIAALVTVVALFGAVSAQAAGDGTKAELRARNYQLENALETMRERVVRLEERKEELEKKVDRLHRQKQAQQTRISRLSGRVERLSDDGYVKALKWQARVNRVRANRLEHENGRLQRAVQDLRAYKKHVATNVTSDLRQFFARVVATLKNLRDLNGDVEFDVANLDEAAVKKKLQPAEVEKTCGALSEAVAKLRRTPLGQPTDSKEYTSLFGYRTHPITGERDFHDGIDFAARMNAPVRATASGRVERVVIDDGYGRMVEIEHPDGHMTRYAHLSSFNVDEGAHVDRGDKIGEIGSSGLSTGPHLHYEVRDASGDPQNPKPYIQAFAPVAREFIDLQRMAAKQFRDIRTGGPAPGDDVE